MNDYMQYIKGCDSLIPINKATFEIACTAYWKSYYNNDKPDPELLIYKDEKIQTMIEDLASQTMYIGFAGHELTVNKDLELKKLMIKNSAIENLSEVARVAETTKNKK